MDETDGKCHIVKRCSNLENIKKQPIYENTDTHACSTTFPSESFSYKASGHVYTFRDKTFERADGYPHYQSLPAPTTYSAYQNRDEIQMTINPAITHIMETLIKNNHEYVQKENRRLFGQV